MKRIALGVVLILCGLGTGAYGVWHFAANLGKDNQQFLAPGAFTFDVKPEDGAAQNVKLWVDHRTVFEGKSYNNGRLDGIEVVLRNAAGEAIALPTSSLAENMRVGGTARVVYARTTLPPGRYTVTIQGLRQPVVFSVSVGYSLVWTFVWFFAPLGGGIVSLVLGILLVVFGAIRMARLRRQQQAA